jgi:hypothetical protein
MGGRHGRKRSPKGIGEQIFAEVEKLTADGKMKRLAASRTHGDVACVIHEGAKGLWPKGQESERLRKLTHPQAGGQ